MCLSINSLNERHRITNASPNTGMKLSLISLQSRSDKHTDLSCRRNFFTKLITPIDLAKITEWSESSDKSAKMAPALLLFMHLNTL